MRPLLRTFRLAAPVFLVSLVCLAAVAVVAPKAEQINKIAAVVNGEMITFFDVQAQATPELMRLGLDRNNPAQQEAVRKVHLQVLDSMISDILMNQEAERWKITVQDSEVDNELRKFVQRSQLSQQEFERQLTQQGLSMDVMRDRVRKGILRHRLLTLMIARKIVITQEDVKKYYEAHKSQFVTDRTVRLGLVIFAPTANADALADKVRTGQMTFEQLAATESIGPNPGSGGDIGTLKWTDLAPAWKEALDGLKAGETSKVILVEGRKAMLKLMQVTTGRSQSIEEATPEIENILREPKLQERFTEYTKQLHDKAVIDIRI
ncbi:peptidyl-prolyl cis-trans isomerase [Nitratidesulfovibrio liaohensis]|uniref:peptidyl-prolyl cis-trans isomerase n=1 Tax=Nitratidesulfovibrio liaohensis TaxID=2604158 RepID=UPI00142406B6|nr:peptidyl-prolyl cis-trans isomerase [Nitratidesulfovibrio liaohensis]NHZ45878.1 peptidylprolyl isomerase [Nitratidesulfovibrio liaohensis]